MRLPRTAFCTVRSTVVIVVVLVSTFILFDSYKWQLFSSWSTFPESPSSPSEFKNSSNSSRPTPLTDISPGTSTSQLHEDRADDVHNPQKDDGKTERSSPPKANAFGYPLKDEPDVLETRENEVRPKSHAYAPESGKPDEHQADFARNETIRSEYHATGNMMAPSTDTDEESHKKYGGIVPEQSEKVSPRNDEHSGQKVAPSGSTEKADSAIQKEKTSSDSYFKEDSSMSSPGPAAVATASGFVTRPIVPAPSPKILTLDSLTSLQKVELDLWQARAAMRRVALAQTNSVSGANGSAQPADGEPFGDVYRNAAIFRQSYREMENRFKVYAYPEGEEPLVHNGPCKEIYAVEGRFIQELQDDSPFLTSDPEVAHVFFLPFSVAMMVTYLYTADSGDMSPLLRFVKDYVDIISEKYPYWNRSEGADHFMLSCHDWGPYVSRADDDLRSKTIRVLCNANISEGYVPPKDASLPEINLVGGEIPTELGGRSASGRTNLAFFAGGDHGPVRPQLFKYWEGKDGDILVYHSLPEGGRSYHEFMKTSKYCLCPGGYEVNSPRIVEAIYNDCVPVIIADNFVLPFSDVLNWASFSIQVLEKDIPNLKTILKAIPFDTYVVMQTRVKQVRHHFLLNQPPKRYDVFHMILHSIWLRRLNIRVLE